MFSSLVISHDDYKLIILNYIIHSLYLVFSSFLTGSPPFSHLSTPFVSPSCQCSPAQTSCQPCPIWRPKSPRWWHRNTNAKPLTGIMQLIFWEEENDTKWLRSSVSRDDHLDVGCTWPRWVAGCWEGRGNSHAGLMTFVDSNHATANHYTCRCHQTWPGKSPVSKWH